ncbi:transporter [Propionigenium maris DSM 9537]|uniref:Transporter n=1 Tax=Propionigenium maris DSM 9537 TaxID=1123000 RepID=A0A9W6GNL1_9FUSO|nr:DMT family transporter [Propionigenium maris]GLI56961.1 transporter [Propionigenium maris DSM 9537]
MKGNKLHIIADLALVLVAIIWGSGFTASKIALDSGFGPFYMMAFRFTIAAVIMRVALHKKLKNITRDELKAGAIVGAFLFFAFGTQTVGLIFTTPSKNAFLTGTNVVMVPFIYWAISRVKPDIYSIIAAVVCFLGIGTLSYDGSFSMGIGDTLSLICAVGFACHISLTGFFAKKVDVIKLAFLQMVFAAILSFGTAIFFEDLPAEFSRTGVLSIIYLGVFSTMVAFFLQTVAQKYTTASRTAIILSTEAIFGTLFSVILLSEQLTVNMIIGGCAIFAAIITVETKWEFLKKKKDYKLESR